MARVLRRRPGVAADERGKQPEERGCCTTKDRTQVCLGCNRAGTEDATDLHGCYGRTGPGRKRARICTDATDATEPECGGTRKRQRKHPVKSEISGRCSNTWTQQGRSRRQRIRWRRLGSIRAFPVESVGYRDAEERGKQPEERGCCRNKELRLWSSAHLLAGFGSVQSALLFRVIRVKRSAADATEPGRGGRRNSRQRLSDVPVPRPSAAWESTAITLRASRSGVKGFSRKASDSASRDCRFAASMV